MTINAEQLMHRDLSSVSEDDSVLDAVHLLFSQRLSGVPVVRDDWVLVGYLSEKDILRKATPTYLEVLAQSSFLDDSEGNLIERLKQIGNMKVRDVMNPDPIFVRPSESLMTVVDLMLRKGLKRLPVVESRKLVGVIDRGGFCEFMMEGSEFHETR
ncbi:MAG TPA: CBS domain-containing protein [Synergistales bacterium]|nr:CBS domain-containing protein [Synergistales bacterium]HQO82379.1 CBS domain-containing protein [Synergistales bacterium]HQQ10353.1 CBS domain-containing protein [Synergistales bacterium]